MCVDSFLLRATTFPPSTDVRGVDLAARQFDRFDLDLTARFAIAERIAALATLVLTAFRAIAVSRALLRLFVLAAFSPGDVVAFLMTIPPPVLSGRYALAEHRRRGAWRPSGNDLHHGLVRGIAEVVR